MKILTLILILGGTLCLTGCLSTQVSKSELTGEEHIFVSDYGWKLFNAFPLFRSDITLERVESALADEAARRGKTATGLTSHRFDNIMFDIPLLVITIPVPYVVCYHEIQLSGVLQ